MSDKKFYQESSFWYGFFGYYIIVYCIAFYPALIFAIWRANVFGDPQEPSTCFFGLILFIVFSLVIKLMTLEFRQTWFYLTCLYGISLYPFVKFVQWVYEVDVPWPGIDWFPW